MNYKTLKILLRIIMVILAICPGSIIALLALYGVRDEIRSDRFLTSPFLYLNLIGILVGFLGMCFCVFNQYNYFTLAMLCLGAIALNIFIQRCVSESEFPFFIMFTLAILIPNGILCLKKQNKAI